MFDKSGDVPALEMEKQREKLSLSASTNLDMLRGVTGTQPIFVYSCAPFLSLFPACSFYNTILAYSFAFGAKCRGSGINVSILSYCKLV
ncbi:hypothetical protein JS44_15350 [Anoxybacillus flavithermus]|uniref:Uncharacterized protein n=1 Tax=Anoxybacillus flavithermus TaxID=33934 RepID=A0A094LBB2_9BACL|nr:hypothetical protein JS44_15350 [Anoxybacillus flavithermus]